MARAPAEPFKVARIYQRVSTDGQDLTRQAAIVQEAKAAGFYVAGVYREKASGARADRPELLRMIEDLQSGEVVIAEKIDRISRLPLVEAERLVASIRAKGARLAVPGVVDFSEVAAEAKGVAKVVLSNLCRTCCCASPCRSLATTTRTAASVSGRALNWRRPETSTVAARLMRPYMLASSHCAAVERPSPTLHAWQARASPPSSVCGPLTARKDTGVDCCSRTCREVRQDRQLGMAQGSP